jgi:hypothetical protein
MTKFSNGFPVNELGEIVVGVGTGTTNVVGSLPIDFIPVDTSNKIAMVGGFSSPSELIEAVANGVTGGTSDDSDEFHSLLANAPSGAQIVLGNKRYTVKYGATYNKPLTITGGGPKTEIYFNPTIPNDTLLRFDITGATIPDKNEEGQLYGPTIRNLRILGKRETRANGLHFYRCDNVCLENVFIEGLKGSSLYLDRTRETHITGYRTRFCGDRDFQIPDVNIVSIEGSADTSNYQLWSNITIVYPFWDGIYANNADQIFFTNLFIHQFRLADENERTVVGNRFGNSPNLYTDWETHFNDATSGGFYAKCLNVRNGSSVRISNIIVRGGTGAEVITADASSLFLDTGEITGSSASASCGLLISDHSANIFFDNLFLDNANQMFIERNSGSVYGVCKRGPTFAASQTQLGSQIMEAYGAEVRYKHGAKFQNLVTLDEGININTGTSTGSKVGSSSTQKVGFWGATPIVRPTVTGSKGGNVALTDLLAKLASAGLIVDSTS